MLGYAWTRASLVHAKIPVAILAFNTNDDALSGLSARLDFSSASSPVALALQSLNVWPYCTSFASFFEGIYIYALLVMYHIYVNMYVFFIIIIIP